MRRPHRQRQQESIQGKAQHKIERGPDETSLAPTHRIIQERRHRPTQGRCETRKESDARDGATGIAAVEGGHRRKAGIIEAKRHAEAENRPGAEQAGRSGGGGERDKSAGQNDIRKDEDTAAATAIDRAPHPRAGDRRDQQGERERSKNPGARDAHGGADWVRQDGWQVVARRPGEGLRCAERRNHGDARLRQRPAVVIFRHLIFRHSIFRHLAALRMTRRRPDARGRPQWVRRDRACVASARCRPSVRT